MATVNRCCKLKMNKPILLESQIQKKFVKYCRESNDPRLRWTHSTQTAGARSIPARMRAKQEGMLAGIADISIPFPSTKYHGLYIEFKSPKAPKKSWNKPDQLEFKQYCQTYNYQYHMLDDADIAIELVNEYLNH